MNKQAKRQKTIRRLEHFIPQALKTRKPLDSAVFAEMRHIEEHDDGMDAIEAFFLKSETGKTPQKVNNLRQYIQLIYAQRRMALWVTEMKRDIKNGLIHSFELDPIEREVLGI
jgi:hypothetical protein